MAEYWEKRHGALAVSLGMMGMFLVAFLGGGWWLRGQFDSINKQFAELHKKVDGLEGRLNTKIAILAMNIPADKKQELLRIVETYKASLPSDPERALQMVLEKGQGFSFSTHQGTQGQHVLIRK